MNGKRILLLLKIIFTLFFLVFFNGCGGDKPKFTPEELAGIPLPQKDGLPQVTGGFVLKVENETITAAEIVTALREHFEDKAKGKNFEQFKTDAAPQVEQFIVNKISDILLYNQGRNKLGENIDEALEKAVKAEVRKYINNFGGDWAKAQQALKRDGMDWTSFKEYQKRIIISQSYISYQMPEKKKVTYNELLDYYNKIKYESFTTPAMIKFRLIDIQPAKLEVTDSNTTRQEIAAKLVNDLLDRIKAGEDFGELARQYSHGHRQMFGGLWKPVQPGSLAKPFDILAEYAEKTKQGQIAGPIEADNHIFIMKLEEKNPEGVKPLAEVQNQIEEKILFEQRKKAVDELTAKLVEEAEIAKKDEFINSCLRRIYLICNQ